MKQDRLGSPFFSVIVPVYNNEKTIKKCIDSILGQSCTDFELILVNDGSTDGTPLLCDGFAERDRRVRVIHKENEGVAAARNDGLFQAAGKYIYYVDGDDWISPGLLQEAAGILKGADPPDIFAFGYTMIEEDGRSRAYSCAVGPGLYPKGRLEREIYPKMMQARGNMTWVGVVSSSLCDKIISRQLLTEHYCRDTSLFVYEDLVCVYECMYFAGSVYFSDGDFYFYNRFSGASMHQRYHKDLFANSKSAARYLRSRMGGRGDTALERQINRLEFGGLVSAVYQELQFKPSLGSACAGIRETIGRIDTFPICPVEGLGFWGKCYVYLLSLGRIYPALLAAKAVIGAIRIRRNKRRG